MCFAKKHFVYIIFQRSLEVQGGQGTSLNVSGTSWRCYIQILRITLNKILIFLIKHTNILFLNFFFRSYLFLVLKKDSSRKLITILEHLRILAHLLTNRLNTDCLGLFFPLPSVNKVVGKGSLMRPFLLPEQQPEPFQKQVAIISLRSE